jgi:DNA-directed RNA polymerase specialized sigma24 family protein
MIEPLRTTWDREELFAERYEWLLGLALQLAGGDAARAEDLLHNAFIQFTLPRADLPPVQNLEGYLYAMLRNVHVSAERQAATAQQLTVAIADYDSAEITLRATDARVQLRAREELRAICRYACLRKETCKAGSVLILRFFHDYFPSEAALIARCTRGDVDRLLWQARREAKSYLDNPASLRFLAEQTTPVAPAVVTSFSPSHDLPAELRAEIFRSRRGDCLSAKATREIYRRDSTAQLDASRLAHFVACERCLKLICKTLGLAALSSDDADAGGTTTRGTGRGPAAVAFFKRGRRRAQEVAEHRPKELRISANGFFLGAQAVNAEVNEQTLKVNIEEPLAFIEVASEQGLRLLVQPVETPPAGEIEQHARLELSDGRSLAVSLSFRSARPTLVVTYVDPALGHARQLQPGAEAEGGEAGGEAQSPALFESFIPRADGRRWNGLAFWRWLRPLPLALLLALSVFAAVVAPRLTKWLRPAPPRVREAAPVKSGIEPPPTAASVMPSATRNAVAPTPEASPAASPSAVPPAVTAQLEIEALSLLAQSGGEVGEQVTVARTPEGRLRVEGLVETDARKAAILRAFAPLSQHPLVQIEIKTIAEALRESKPTSGKTTALPSQGSVAVREFSATENDVPAAAELRRYFAGAGDEAEERVRQYARHMAAHATQTMLHAAELRRLAKRFSADELGALDGACRARWRALIRTRARALAGQLNRLSDELRPVFFVASGGEPVPEPDGDAALLRAIEQLYGQCATVDRLLRAAFTIPASDAPATSQVKTAQFWRSLTSAEALAARIAATHN